MKYVLVILTAWSIAPAFAADFADCKVYVTSAASPDIGGKPLVFHNTQLEDILGSGMSQANVRTAIKLLLQQGTFDIPVDESGFIAAAQVGNHGGGYGNNIWLRDLARIYFGLVAKVELLEKVTRTDNSFGPRLESARADLQRTAKAMLQITGNSQWRDAALANIRNPHHADHGHANVIWVRRNILPFKENREPTPEELAQESAWGHKQNDGVGAFALAVLDSIDRGLNPRDQISPEAKLNLHLLPAYFQRLRYWQMWDVGAWEELMALRSSSVGIVVALLEKMRARGGFAEAQVPEDVREMVENSFRDIDASIQHGYDTLGLQLLGHRVTESHYGQDHAKHYEDGAIFHLNWHRPERFDAATMARILNGLKPLERSSGYNRYKNDWFLYGPAQAALHSSNIGLYGVLAIPDGPGRFKQASPEDKAAIVKVYFEHERDKNMAPVVQLTGEGYDAGWVFFDGIAGSAWAMLARETGSAAFRAEALRHGQRLFAQVTGFDQITTEGKPVEPYRWPEAFIPVPVMLRGNKQIMYMVSPNSPLNWTIAEATILSSTLWDLAD